MSQMFACPPDKVAALKGIDFANLDWAKIINIIQLLVSLFGGGPVTAQSIKAACPDCPDEVCTHCCEAMHHALTAAMHSAQCCQDAKAKP